MFRFAVIAFVLAIVAAIFGQGGLSHLATQAAIVLFLIALVMLVLGLVGGRGRGGPPAI